MASGAEEAGGVVSTHWRLRAAAREWPLRMRGGKDTRTCRLGSLSRRGVGNHTWRARLDRTLVRRGAQSGRFKVRFLQKFELMLKISKK